MILICVDQITLDESLSTEHENVAGIISIGIGK